SSLAPTPLHIFLAQPARDVNLPLRGGAGAHFICARSHADARANGHTSSNTARTIRLLHGSGRANRTSAASKPSAASRQNIWNKGPGGGRSGAPGGEGSCIAYPFLRDAPV